MFYNVSTKTLPYLTTPLEGELFSSWFTRSALKFNYSPLHFSKIIFSTQNIWNRDIDKSISFENLTHFAKINCVSVERAKETTLSNFNNILFEDLVINSFSRFIIPAGVYHRLRKRLYMQFCPTCLKSRGYYKQTWRIALYTVCPYCKTFLHNCCPHCTKPILFYRTKVEYEYIDASKKISQCYFCGFNLENSQTVQAEEKVVELTNIFNKKIIRAQQSRTTINFDLNYFNGINCILFALRPTNKTRHELLKELCSSSLFPYKKDTFKRSLQFEFLDLNIRYNLIYALSVLLDEWPDKFIFITNTNDLKYSDFNNYNGKEIPYWLYKILKSKK